MCKIHLYTTFYPESKPERKQELERCLHNNLANPCFTSVTLLNEGADLSQLHSEKLSRTEITERPTYQDFISHINKNSNPEDIHIIANTDIYFDENIEVLKYVNLENTCFALSRWDTTETKKPKLYNHSDSQDVWIFKGRINPKLNADFPLGVPRCDNRLMYTLQEAGYRVLNPAYSIKSFHIHQGQRALVYTEDDNIYKIPPPYRYLYPHNLYGFWKTLAFNRKHEVKLGRYRYDIKKINFWWPVRFIRKSLEIISRKKLPLIGYN